MKFSNLFFALLLLLLFGCKTSQQIPELEDDGKITFKFVQLNDVYEIAPLSGGKYGGMARVAYVVDSIKKAEPNTYLFLAGDFLNPSLLGTIKMDGERIGGKQMIEVMNAMNFDLVTFGNHEFDFITLSDLTEVELTSQTFIGIRPMDFIECSPSRRNRRQAFYDPNETHETNCVPKDSHTPLELKDVDRDGTNDLCGAFLV